MWYTYLPIYLSELGFSLSFIGVLASFNLFLCAILQPSEGKLIDKYPAKVIIIPGFAIMAVFGYAFFGALNKIYLVATRALLGLGGDFAWAPVVADMARFTKRKNVGLVNALLQFFTTLASAVSLIAAGYLADVFGVKAILIGSITIAIVGGLIVAHKIKMRNKKVPTDIFHLARHIGGYIYKSLYVTLKI